MRLFFLPLILGRMKNIITNAKGVYVKFKKYLWISVLLFFYSYSMDQRKLRRESGLQKLPLEKQIGQLFVVKTVADLESDEIQDASGYRLDKNHVGSLIKDFHIGGIAFSQISTAQNLRDTITYYQGLNAQTNKIPLLVCADFEWGLTQRVRDAVRFPKNMTLGAIGDDALLYFMGREVARQSRLLGVNLVFAPVADINTNPENPIINDRSFGENPLLVTQKASAIRNGLQDGGVIACLKHFPGHGDSSQDSHLTLPTISHDKDRIESVELYPFKKLAQTSRAIMMAHLSVSALGSFFWPTSLSHRVVTTLLRGRLGFKGLIITDALDMQAVKDFRLYSGVECAALRAGNDILLMSPAVPDAALSIRSALETKLLSKCELKSHVAKILAAKKWVRKQVPLPVSNESLYDQLHTQYASELKRVLYRDAVTLVRNDNEILPLKVNENVCYVQVGLQDLTPFKQSLAHYCTKAFSVASDLSNADIEKLLSMIESTDKVIVGMLGMNRSAAQNYGVTEGNRNLIARLKNHCKNTALVLFGSPYSLKWFEDVPAIVVAYEDDEDAQKGTVEVLTGAHNPTAKLPVSGSRQFLAGTGLRY